MNLLDILGNIGFDWRIALANLVNFFIIFYLLKRFAFGPVKDMLAKRSRLIEEGVENARRAETDRMMAGEERRREILRARDEANAILSQTNKEQEALVVRAVEKAQKEAQQVERQAHERIARERQRMEQELRMQTADLVVRGLEKVLREEMDQQTGERLIKKIISTA